jgi:hypothetical protein
MVQDVFIGRLLAVVDAGIECDEGVVGALAVRTAEVSGSDR